MKQIFTFLNNFIMPMQLIATVILIYQFHTFNPSTPKLEVQPEKLVTNITTPNLGTKGSFIYFEGKLEGEQKAMLDHYEYDAKFPDEIFEGYITLAKSYKGSEYWIWSRTNNLDLSNKEIKGWFFTDNLSTFEEKKNKYLQVLYPVVEKQFQKGLDNINK